MKESNKNHIVITIDGPAASGKSSVAKMIAQRLGFYYLYTGLLYRAVAYVLVQQQFRGVAPKDAADIVIPSDLSMIKKIVYSYSNGEPRVAYDGQDISPYLCDASFDQPASVVSANKAVRQALLDVQRNVAQHYDLVADGRDCGTVIFPNATIKFFLTADAHTRAVRLFNDRKRAYSTMSVDQIKELLIERDNRDQARAVAPLVVPDGAMVIDSSHLSLEQTVEAFVQVIKQQLG